MEDHSIDVSRFRERCCYCYKDVSDGIHVCMCGLSFCDDHIDVHFGKVDGCSGMFDVKRTGGDDMRLEVQSILLDDDEVMELRKRLECMIGIRNESERVVQKEEEIDCTHMNDDDGCIEVGDIEKLRCNSCDVSSRLWICFSCGYVGCGRVQYGVEGNGHAKEHHDQTHHNAFILSSSLCTGDCEVFCYLCDSNIRNRYDFLNHTIRIDSKHLSDGLNKKIEFHGSIDEGKNETKEIDEEKTSEISPYVGIINAGNTCYISSILHLIGYVVSIQDIDLESHFQLCYMGNPLECFFCQLIRVFIRMKKARNEHGTDKISILDFVVLVWRDMPMFTKYVQHDSHEFLLFLLEKIREGEKSFLVPSMTSSFDFEVGERIICSNCSDESITYETMSMLCTIIKSRMRECVKAFFNGYEWDCECGGRKRTIRFVTRLPEYLIIQIGRYSYDNDESGKVKDKIGMESIRFDKFMSEVPEDLETRTNEQRNDPKYRVVGCVNHSGTNVRSGHYTWWVYDDERCYLVDDTHVLNSNVEMLEDGYIYLFR